jgi:hypothetical protein
MMVDRAMVRASRGSAREIGIWPLIIWAFRSEFAQLDFDDLASEASGRRSHMGMEAILMERCRVGCKVDGGGRSDPHPDADLIAAALATLPEGCGGRRMAVDIVELARAGRCPDWHVEQSIAPVSYMQNRHGLFSNTADAAGLGDAGWPAVQRTRRRGGVAEEPVLYCPVTIVGTASTIAAKRRAYLQWWSALLELRTTFQLGRDLSAWVVTDAMPPMKPWQAP